MKTIQYTLDEHGKVVTREIDSDAVLRKRLREWFLKNGRPNPIDTPREPDPARAAIDAYDPVAMRQRMGVPETPAVPRCSSDRRRR